MVNLDTHILLFALSGEVTARERRILSGNDWSLSAIVLWELAKLVQLGRVDLDLEDADVVRTLSSMHVWPVDLPVSLQSTRLDFKGRSRRRADRCNQRRSPGSSAHAGSPDPRFPDRPARVAATCRIGNRDLLSFENECPGEVVYVAVTLDDPRRTR